MEQSGGMLLPVCTLLLALFPMSSAVPIRYRGNWAKPDYSIYHSMCGLLSIHPL